MLTPQDLLVDDADLTDDEYECTEYVCDCGKPVMYIADPEYDLVVGIGMGIPKELMFTDADVDFRQMAADPLSTWHKHLLATGPALMLQCLGCGHENQLHLCGPDGDEMLILTGDSETVQKQIPVDRVPYVENKPAKWEERENMSESEIKELMGKA